MGGTVRTARIGDDVVLPRRSETGEIEATSFWTAIWNADLVALDPESGSVRTLLSLSEAMGDLTAKLEELSGGFPPFPLWYRLWAVCSGNEIRLHDFVRDELRGFTAEGVELDPVPVPPPFTEVTRRQFARVMFDFAVMGEAGTVAGTMADLTTADSTRILAATIRWLDGTPQQLAGCSRSTWTSAVPTTGRCGSGHWISNGAGSPAGQRG